MNNLYGIDYGSKLAGTTVVAFLPMPTPVPGSGSVVQFASSARKQDADAFLLDFFSERPSGQLYIDAPLGVPKACTLEAPAPAHATPDFHYRACDRALGAMSPMFLGGLTARAMKLAFQLRQVGHCVYETYPGALARHLQLTALGYKSKHESIDACLAALLSVVPSIYSPADQMVNWHHFDALLALCSGLRHSRGEAISVGDEEGTIIF